MNLKFHNKEIEGILTIIPAREVKFEEEMEHYNFSPAKSLKLKMAMGYNKHCIVEDGVCVSDLLIHGLNHLFNKNLLIKDEIDAMVLVTQSPDYFMPATSNVIQGKLGLKQDMICMDINQGCAGYIIGLIQAFLLLEQEEVNKVLLLNADVLSRKVSKRDRNSNPLIGDGASVTVVKKSKEQNTIYGFIKMDGVGAESIMIPAGGFRIPSTAATAVMHEDSAGNFRSPDNLVMKGDDVFNFVQREVPPMIEHLLEKASCKKEDVDYYMFHQPNRFMLQKLADKLGISYEKMPNNIVANFGNSSGVSIPTNIGFNIGSKLLTEQLNICLAGFGVGLTWACLLMKIGNLKFNEIIIF
ncbi:MAG TPA: ketoacyl-ACP synthase III [Hanamia sp.]|nr:ketoacyl-ACP synthase III [Hanamia sp.]